MKANKMNRYTKISPLALILTFTCLTASAQEKEISGPEVKEWSVESDSLSGVKTGAVTFTDLMAGESSIQVLQNGVTGQAAQLMIRGIHSVNLSTSPLILVDGVPVRYSRNLPSFLSTYEPSRFNFINPNDIRDIRVTNGGYELSMLGGRGSNGAISIMTDRGELGGTKIDFSARFGVLESDYGPDRMGAVQFKDYLRRYMAENGSTEDELNGNPLFDASLPQYNANTNWMGLISRKAKFNDYHLKLKGGDGDAAYLFSVGYTKKEETIEASDLERISLRFNLDYKLSPRIEISNNLSYSYTNSHYAEQGANYSIHPVFVAATKAPFLSPYLYSATGERTGQLSDTDVLGKSNPVSLVSAMDNNNEENRIDGIIGVKWQLAKETWFRSAFAFNYFNLMEKQYRPSKGIVNDMNRLRQNSKRTSSELMIAWNSWFERQGKIGKTADYQGKAGFTVETREEKSVFVRKINAGSDDYETLEQGTVDTTSNLNYESNLLTFYLNGSLDLFRHLKLYGNVNVEGSSNFGSEGRWGIYPGVKGIFDLLDRGKKSQVALFGGWGRSANHDLRGYYQYSLFYPANYFGYGGVYFGNVANRDIKPETTDTWDAGISFSLFNKRLVLDGGYYSKKTSDLITQRVVPIEIGLDPQFENNGIVSSHGFELSANLRLIDAKKLTWSVYGNLSTLENEVEKLNNGDITRSLGNVTTIAREGEAIGSFYGYKVLGVFRSEADVDRLKADGTAYRPGDYIIEDLNHDSRINENDRQVIGSALPDLFGNFGTTVTCRRLSLNAVFSWASGNDLYNGFGQQMHLMSDYSNQSPEVSGRWISESQPGNGLSRAAFDDPSGNGAASNLWIEDGSYIKLKNITLSYDVPVKGFLNRLSLYFTGENLLTFTDYSGFDPEVVTASDPMLRGIDFGSTPAPKSYLLGIKMSF
jgi:TonB-linked SusC/RagA family outer membrane protein